MLCAYSLADAFAEVGLLSSTSFFQPYSIRVLFFIGFLGFIKGGANDDDIVMYSVQSECLVAVFVLI